MHFYSLLCQCPASPRFLPICRSHHIPERAPTFLLDLRGGDRPQGRTGAEPSLPAKASGASVLIPTHKHISLVTISLLDIKAQLHVFLKKIKGPMRCFIQEVSIWARLH